MYMRTVWRICILMLECKGLTNRWLTFPTFLVPFRDSVLTKLLKNALGGNSKTIMVCWKYPYLQDDTKKFYHINCGIIQRFPALRKVVTTRKKISYFLTCVDITNQLLTRHSPLASLGQADEWTAKPSRFSVQVFCRKFLELWRLKY